MNDFKIIGDLPVLETERLVLRKFDVKDADDLYEYCSDAENIKYVTFNKYEKYENALDRIDDLKAKYAQSESGCWAIELKENGKMIGSIDLVHVWEEYKKAELGYIINKKYWNQGYTTEAAKKVIEYCFNNLDLVRVQANCIEENIASARVMEKSGMKYEGLQLKSMFRNNQYYNVKEYAIIK